MKQREQQLADIGSTTALSAMVEIVSNKRPDGILARQVRAMLERLSGPDQVHAIAGFCDELQGFIESVPGARRLPAAPERSRGRRAA